MQMTAEELEREGFEFYRDNPSLMSAHRQAAELFNRRGAPVSSRMLTDFVRLLRLVGADGAWELAMIYSGVEWPEKRDYMVPNSTTAWLTRELERLGYRTTKARSRMDEVEGC